MVFTWTTANKKLGKKSAIGEETPVCIKHILLKNCCDQLDVDFCIQCQTKCQLDHLVLRLYVSLHEYWPVVNDGQQAPGLGTVNSVHQVHSNKQMYTTIPSTSDNQ